MAKKSKKGNKASANRADALRDAVERTFTGAAGAGSGAQKRMSEVFDDFGAAFVRLRETLDERGVIETLEALTGEVAALAQRVANLERGGGSRPVVKKPAPKRSTGARKRKPAARRSGGTTKRKPAARKPAAKRSAAKRSAAKKPAARKPAAKRSTAKRSAPKRSAAKKPAASKPAAKKPAAKSSPAS